MKRLVLSFGLLLVAGACNMAAENSTSTRGADSTDPTAQGAAGVGAACGGGAGAACDESSNLYCSVSDSSPDGSQGTCASCTDLGPIELVCDDGTIQTGQWIAFAQTCQIIGCGTAGLGATCNNSAADPSVTCALGLVCAQSSVTTDGTCTQPSDADAGPAQTDDAGADAATDDANTDAGADAATDDANADAATDDANADAATDDGATAQDDASSDPDADPNGGPVKVAPRGPSPVASPNGTRGGK